MWATRVGSCNEGTKKYPSSESLSYSGNSLTKNPLPTIGPPASNCASAIRVTRGKVSSAKVVFGAVANKPFVAERAAAALVGTRIDGDAPEYAGDGMGEDT